MTGALAVACTSNPDTTAGAEIFARDTIGGLEGCSSCHSADERPSPRGPTLVGVGRWAGERVEDMIAEDFIRESILVPTAQFAPGWGEGMPSYAGALSTDEVDALVAYLTSLR